jgi:hypothetical protein
LLESLSWGLCEWVAIRVVRGPCEHGTGGWCAQSRYSIRNKPTARRESRSSCSIAEVTPKAEDKGQDIVNDFLKYHAIDPNSAEDCFNELLHAVMSSCDYYCKATIANQELHRLTSAHKNEKECLQHHINKFK